ncbi:MAG: flavin reductase family protein [Candidatus Caenarcaniphilales bacterium]|nr:flavin reductase family protein [Candidatus Caenarcaniphilales bacterium]
MADEAREGISHSLGKIPSGLFIVTFFNQELNQPDGILMSWVQQVSFEPPAVSVATKKDRKGLELIKKAKYFVVNIMGKENAKMIGSFYKGIGEAKFEGINTIKAKNSNTLILEDAVSYLECELSNILETEGDHVIMFGKILSGQLLNSDQNEPSVHLRKNGFDY